METIKNKINDNNIQFFEELSEFLDTKLLFFGSVQRADYFPGESDIDVDVFTENENQTIAKLQHFLHAKRSQFKKCVWRLNHNNQVVYGHKIFYKNNEEKIFVEFSIYNEKYKQGVLKEHLLKTNLPFYASWFLILLKFLFYNLKIIDKKTFTYWKKKILSVGIGLPESQFVVFDEK
jgi:predicted nucleotidyltransferase